MGGNNSPANQHSSDERESKCWELYLASLEYGKPNAMKAALEAGYSNDHARNITMQGWFKDRLSKLRRGNMLSKAERNLDEFLDMKTQNVKETSGGDSIVVEDSQLKKIKLDASKFVAERLGKDDGYSTRNEQTGKGGAPIAVEVSRKEEIEKALDDI